MNHAHYRIINVPLHKTVIKSCKCYEEYWKELKEKAKPYIPFDYSIEKVFTYRKYFANDNLLYHFCINCLYEVISNIPKAIIECELIIKGRLSCIFKYKLNDIPLGEICCLCVNFIIHRFSSNFIIDV